MERIVLGVDPGTCITGYGVVKDVEGEYIPLDYGCIKPPVKLELPDRYLIIFSGIEELIKKHKPHALVVETQYVKNNPQSALKLGMARGVIIVAARKNQIPVFECAPTKAKLAVVGNGKASKAQVQAMTQQILNLPVLPEPEDAADALALAISHLHQPLRK